VVIETVGKATWAHSVRSLRPGGTLVTGGATSGDDLDHTVLARIFFLQLAVVGSIMGTRDELARLSQMLVTSGVRPVIDSTRPLTDAAEGLRAMAEGDVFGKIVFET
jgi:NADPH:quinone reductase-like Zn-dependent oxidoreductase